MEPIRASDYSGIVVLTGAGVSVASGLRPYRGPGGLWEEVGAEVYADARALETDPEKVWGFFGTMRAQVARAAPNPAHVALAEFEQRLGPQQRFTLLTQNVDGLHQRAGSRNVVEIHGSLGRTRCSGAGCSYGREERPDTPASSRCPQCGSFLRADVVLFGEPLPPAAERSAKTALRDCDLFLAVGTSGTVSPASTCVRSAKYAGARTILVNLDPVAPRNDYFDEEVLGRAEELLPVLLGQEAA